jgi:putative oligomerization/nucleic acid binding protein
MHASTRILLLLLAGIAIVAGWWVLLAINGVPVGIVYSIVWTVAVLIVARLLNAAGFGYNRFTARRRGDAPSGGTVPATALAELSDLRDRGLITPEEYDAKRARIIERL